MNEPKLRFKAFSDELSHHTLMDIIVEKPSNGIMNRQSDKVTAVKHINVIDMYTDDKIHVDELSYSEYDDTAVEKCNVEIGDIFLTRSSVKADGIAKSNILLDDGIYVYDDHLIRIKVDKSKYIPEFVNDYLASPRFRRQFIVRAKTTAFTTIGQGDVASCAGDFPSLPEQQKIAEFLSTIDTVIEKQKETVSAWEERKKGVMQRLFSQEVRFKANDGSDFPEWEKKKIGDVCEQIKETIDPMSKPKNLFVEYSMPAFDNEMKPDIVYGDTMNSIRKVIRRPCVLINKLNVRKRRIWNVANPEDNAVCSAEFVPLTSDVMNLTFVTYFALTDWFTKHLLDCSTGSSNSQKRVTPDVILNVKMSVPCLAEQQKIADCLSSLDEVIEKQKATLAAWEELKKGLLQQMFI